MPISWSSVGSPQAAPKKKGGIDWGSVPSTIQTPKPIPQPSFSPPATSPTFSVNPAHKGITGALLRTAAKVGNVAAGIGGKINEVVRPVLGSKPAEEAAKGAINTFNDAKQRIIAAHDTFSKGHSISERTGAISHAAIGVANVLLSPVGALMAVGSQVPGIKYPVAGLNAVSGGIDKLSHAVTNRIIDHLPIHEDTKSNLRESAGEIASLAAQIALFKGAEKLPGAIDAKVNEPISYLENVRNRAAMVSAEQPTKIPVRGEPGVESKLPVREVPTVRGEPQPTAIEPLPPERSLSRLGKANTTHENLPVGSELFHKDLGKFTITDQKLVPDTAGKLTKGVEITDATGQTADFTLRELQGLRKVNKNLNLPKVEENAPLGAISPTERVSLPTHPEGGIDFSQVTSSREVPPTEVGPTVTKAASDINTKLAAKSLETLPESELAKFTSTNKADQIEKIAQIVSDPERTAKIVAGKEAVPNDVVQQAFFKTVEAKALADNNVEMLRNLAKSPLASAQSIAAQELGAVGLYGDATSPVEAIKSVAKAREAATAKRLRSTSDVATKKAIGQIKESVKKAAPTKANWNDFIKELQC